VFSSFIFFLLASTCKSTGSSNNSSSILYLISASIADVTCLVITGGSFVAVLKSK
jgi:hypothetical protein